jgi:hypothetical protein
MGASFKKSKPVYANFINPTIGGFYGYNKNSQKGQLDVQEE